MKVKTCLVAMQHSHCHLSFPGSDGVDVNQVVASAFDCEPYSPLLLPHGDSWRRLSPGECVWALAHNPEPPLPVTRKPVDEALTVVHRRSSMDHVPLNRGPSGAGGWTCGRTRRYGTCKKLEGNRQAGPCGSQCTFGIRARRHHLWVGGRHLLACAPQRKPA